MSRIKSEICASAVLLFLGILFTAEVVFAQASECGKKRDVPNKALDELTYKQLNKVFEDVGEEHYDDAYTALQRLMARAGRDIYLQAVLHQALAQVEWSRENLDSSLDHFEKAVELDSLPDQPHFALMYQIAQLYYMNGRYQDALDSLDLWFCKSPPESIKSAAYVLQASIHAQQENYNAALKAIETAIAMDENPKEAWYQIKLAAHYELEQYPQAAETLEIIIVHWPDKKSYWIQLSQIYFKLKQDEKALAILALAYRRNMLDKQSDIIYLSSLYSTSDVPYKAAGVLEKGINDGIVESTQYHWTVVADGWYVAEELEKSLSAFEKAGSASVDGKIDLRRGYLLIDLERWQDALAALSDAIEKGGLTKSKTGEAYLLRGMAHFNLGNFDSASSDWGKAARYERHKESARQWMNHMREERRRKAS